MSAATPVDRIGGAPAAATPAAAVPAAGGDFREALQAASREFPAPGSNPATKAPQAADTVLVREADTLSAIAQRALKARGLDASGPAIMRAAIQIAKTNGLANPDFIRPGQNLILGELRGPGPATQAAVVERPGNPGVTPSTPILALKTPVAGRPVTPAATRQITQAATLSNTPVAARQIASPVQTTARVLAQRGESHPVLDRTITRAVKLGYIKPNQVNAARQKILHMAEEHRFRPDDLATVTLMESDGMNPKSSNGHCHGVIQFCDGPNRGAASVGYKDKAYQITKLGVLDQLELVNKYFKETGLKQYGQNARVSLDDLYLTVLTPAARRERSPDGELDIAGPQASALHMDKDTSAPITRTSLLAGLREIARAKLAPTTPAANQAPAKPLQLSQLSAARKTPIQ